MKKVFLLIIFVTGVFGSEEVNIHTPAVSINNFDNVIFKLNSSDLGNVHDFRSNGNVNRLKEEYRNIGNFLESFGKQIKNRECKKQFSTFLEGLQNSSIWAIQMLDASSKIPSGLAAVNTYHFGNYDECIEIFVPEESIHGKYCLAKVRLAPKWKKYSEFYAVSEEEEFSLVYDPIKPVWDKFKVTKDPSKKRRDVFYSGVCIPNKCSAKDVELFLTSLVKRISTIYGYEANITIEDKSCDTNETKQIRGEAKVLGFIITVFIISVLISTIWDATRKKSKSQHLSNFQRLMESFSLKRNLTKLSKPDPSNEMDVFHGMKALSMILILLGHRCLASYGGPLLNPEFFENRYRKFIDMLLLNGTLIVDTFFMIGAYLTFIGLTSQLENKKKLKPTDVYLHRWLRITPVYMLVVFFYAYILEHLGNGPYWSTRVGREAERCRENWWTNLFYINNYVNTDKLCMFQSWYVTCDMHYTLIAPILIKIIWENPKRGLRILGFCILASVMIPFIITYWNKYDGVLRVYMSIFEDLSASFTFSNVYIKTHNRAIPYFIGMAAAYIYLQLKRKNFQFSRLQSWIFSLLGAFFALSSIFGAHIFYIPGRRYDALENALYACLHRVFWASSMAFVAIAGGRRGFGIIQPVLSHRMYTPLSRLSYGAFLVHGAIQLYTTATLRRPEYMCYSKLFWMTSGDVALSFFVSLIIYLFIEAPVDGVQKLLLPKRTGIKKLSNAEVQNETVDSDNKSLEKLKES